MDLKIQEGFKMSETELMQEQYADLKKYIPESPTVKAAFEEIMEHKIDNWEEAIQQMISSSLSGDKEALFDLLELTYLNAHNEGFLDGIEPANIN
jgi:hypothetical protein